MSDEKCTVCGKDIDPIAGVLETLHNSIDEFLDYGSPADLLEEIANHFRDIFESDEDEPEAVPEAGIKH